MCPRQIAPLGSVTRSEEHAHDPAEIAQARAAEPRVTPCDEGPEHRGGCADSSVRPMRRRSECRVEIYVGPLER